jgi:uncharacterized RDD family membrane protein YckC
MAGGKSMIKRVHQKQSSVSRKSGNQWGNGGAVYQTKIHTLPNATTRRYSDRECGNCGTEFDQGAGFCVICGSRVKNTPRGIGGWAKARPSIFRRFFAELIDRPIPYVIASVIALPMALVGLKYYFWLCASVIFGWNLLRDSAPERRSVGKKRFGLRVVAASGQGYCSLWRTIARRWFSAVTQTAYFVGFAALVAKGLGWDALLNAISLPWPTISQSKYFGSLLVLSAVIYDLFSVACAWVSSDGRRFDDYLAGTRVILESAYVHNHKQCGGCGGMMPKRSIYCPHCGERNAPVILPMAAD